MKKIYLVVVLIISSLLSWAQNIDDVRKFILLKQYGKGKEEVDKFLNTPANSNNAEAWYYKAFVYNVLSRDASHSVMQNQQLNLDAYTALKKYREVDPKEKFTKEEENSTIYNVYFGFYDIAVKTYNSKDYEQSFTNFSNALNVHDYIFSNNLTGAKVGGKPTSFAALDTDVVFNLVILGEELKKTDETVNLYKKLIAANVKDEKYQGVYEGIVMHYKKMKNQASFDEYLLKGKTIYPKAPFWEAIDIENATDGLEKIPLFDKYEELTAKYPNSYVLYFNYAFELNKYVYSDEPKTGDMAAYKTKIPALFNKAIAINSTVDANMLLANFYYNNSYDISDESKKIKGTKPEDAKKRQELNNSAKAVLNLCIPVAEEAIRLFAAMPKLKGSEKINYKQALDILSTVYKINGDLKKSEEYDKKKLEVDKL